MTSTTITCYPETNGLLVLNNHSPSNTHPKKNPKGREALPVMIMKIIKKQAFSPQMETH